MEYFTITQCDNNTGAGLATYPVMFSNYEDAMKYLDYIRNASFTYQITKNFSHVLDTSVSSHVESTAPNSYTKYNDTDTDNSLNGYNLRYHKNCLVLSHPQITSTDSKYFYGKDFNSGWWNDSLQGWVFRKEHETLLVSYGASFESSTPDHSEDETPEETSNSLSGYVVYSYKRGYILKCDFAEETPYFWDEYKEAGWWNKNEQGWFFTKSYLQELLDDGAEFIEKSTYQPVSVPSKNVNPFDKTKWSQYGQGWLLKPSKNHPNYGEKYFGEYNNGGWWMDAQKGWFFKDSEYQNIVNA